MDELERLEDEARDKAHALALSLGRARVVLKDIKSQIKKLKAQNNG